MQTFIIILFSDYNWRTAEEPLSYVSRPSETNRRQSHQDQTVSNGILPNNISHNDTILQGLYKPEEDHKDHDYHEYDSYMVDHQPDEHVKYDEHGREVSGRDHSGKEDTVGGNHVQLGYQGEYQVEGEVRHEGEQQGQW